MGEISRPGTKPPRCKHNMPPSDSVPKGTKWYCDYCHKVFMTYPDDYGYSWERWPLSPLRIGLLIVLAFIALTVVAAILSN